MKRYGDLIAVTDSGGLLLGGARAGKWIEAKEVVPTLNGGERLRFYGFSGAPKRYEAKKPVLDEASGDAYFIPFKGKPVEPQEGTVGVGGTHNAQPRRMRSESVTQSVYVKAVADVLAKQGLRVARPRLTRVVRLDLSGKGSDSVLMEARSANYRLLPAERKRSLAYSLVLLRTMVRGRLQTFLLGGGFIKPGQKEQEMVEEFLLAPPVDIDGDGVYEIVVESRYYEGGGARVFSIQSGEPKEVLSAIAGA